MGDRIAIMKVGQLQQVAQPLELYNKPANLFVAEFIGSPPMNFFVGAIYCPVVDLSPAISLYFTRYLGKKSTTI
jgi:multiple sugar transport system ATP-binding protein